MAYVLEDELEKALVEESDFFEITELGDWENYGNWGDGNSFRESTLMHKTTGTVWIVEEEHNEEDGCFIVDYRKN